MKFILSDRIELLRRLNAERSRALGPWEFEPAKNSGYITTIFGRYKSGEPAGLAYTASGDADQQNTDAEFICAMTNAADDLFAERAAMMTRIAQLNAALRYALPILRKYGHTQGDNEAYHAELIAPVVAALGDGSASAPADAVTGQDDKLP